MYLLFSSFAKYFEGKVLSIDPSQDQSEKFRNQVSVHFILSFACFLLDVRWLPS